MTATPADRLILQDCLREAEIGVFQSEHGRRQRLRFTVEVTLAPRPADLADEVDAILSYDFLVAAVDRALVGDRVELLETLAERVAALCLDQPLAATVRVRIEKLDLGPHALGVEITRARAARRAIAAPVAPRLASWVLYLPAVAIEAPGLCPWVEDLAGLGAPLVIAPGPMPGPPRAVGAAPRRRIRLLSQDQAGWLLADRLPDSAPAATRTEIAAVLARGRIAVWLPERLIRGVSEAVLADDPPAQAAWLAREIGASRLLGLDTPVPGGERLAPGRLPGPLRAAE